MKGSIQNSRAGSTSSLVSSPASRNTGGTATPRTDRSKGTTSNNGDQSLSGQKPTSMRRGVLAPGSKAPSSQLGFPAAATATGQPGNSATGASPPGRARRTSVGSQFHQRTSSVSTATGAVARPVADDLPPLEPAAQALCDRVGISPREYLELTEVFRLVDKDGGGTISKDELELLMRTLGIRASKVEMDIMVNEIVNDPSKEEIDLEAFITAMSRKVTTSLPEDQLMAAFRQFDEGGALTPLGRIKTEHLFTILQSMGDSSRFMKHEDVEDLLTSVAPQALATGHFDYANFVRMLFSS